MASDDVRILILKGGRVEELDPLETIVVLAGLCGGEDRGAARRANMARKTFAKHAGIVHYRITGRFPQKNIRQNYATVAYEPPKAA